MREVGIGTGQVIAFGRGCILAWRVGHYYAPLVEVADNPTCTILHEPFRGRADRCSLWPRSCTPGKGTKPEIHIGVVPVRSPDMSVDVLESFARRTAADIGPVLEKATGASWSFHLEAPYRLVSDEPRRAADFLDEASLRMVEGPYDAVVVMTDVAVLSRKQRVGGTLRRSCSTSWATCSGCGTWTPRMTP